MTNREHFIATLQACYFGDRNAFNEIVRIYDEKENIIKEVREILNNKRTIMTTQLLSGGYCNYEELLYQVDEEIGKILDKVGDNSDE